MKLSLTSSKQYVAFATFCWHYRRDNNQINASCFWDFREEFHMLDRRKFVAASFGALAGVSSRSALAQNTDVIKIGVITDLTGPFKDIEGPTGVVCAKLAAQEFMAANPGIKVEVLSADHQNKADIGLGVIREWLDRQGVDLISDVGNSAVALGARTLLESMDKVAIVTSAGSSDLTGKSCSPQLIHWGWDTWCLAHSNAT